MQLIAPPSDTRLAFEYDYTAKALLTESEARFHACLEAISQHRCRILIKPRLADVFQHRTLEEFNKISQKHVDFLICRNDDWQPMLGIELDDPTHNTKKVKERDMFVNGLFASTGIPLLRIDVSEMAKVESLVKRLSQAWVHRWEALEKS